MIRRRGAIGSARAQSPAWRPRSARRPPHSCRPCKPLWVHHPGFELLRSSRARCALKAVLFMTAGFLPLATASRFAPARRGSTVRCAEAHHEDSGDPRGDPLERGAGPMTRQNRVVPDSFEEFSARRVRRLTEGELLATGPYGCRGCGEHAAFGYLDASGELLCEACLRYQLGYEQAEEKT